MDGTDFMGRNLKVNRAKPREERGGLRDSRGSKNRYLSKNNTSLFDGILIKFKHYLFLDIFFSQTIYL